MVEIFGIDIYGNELGFYDRLYATFDLAGGLALEAVGVVGGLQQASRGAGRGGPRQLAETGEIVTDVRNLEVGTPVSPISYGMMDADARHIRHVADEFGVVVEFRPANVDSMGWQARGHPRKPVKIKQKTINEIDVHLGADANNIGLAGYFEPTLPANLDELSPGLQTEIRGRHSQRLKEFNDGKVELGAMQDAGKIRLEDGLIIDTGLCGDTGLAITGDLDPWRVTRNGRELNAVETQPIIDALADGPANVQHSTHVTWDVPSGPAAHRRHDPRQPSNHPAGGRRRVVDRFRWPRLGAPSRDLLRHRRGPGEHRRRPLANHRPRLGWSRADGPSGRRCSHWRSRRDYRWRRWRQRDGRR